MENKLKVATKKEVFLIPDSTGVLLEVIGRRTEIDGVKCFIHQDETTSNWIISHLESGCQISSDKSKLTAGLKAFFNVMNQPELLGDHAKQLVISNGFNYPVNV